MATSVDMIMMFKNGTTAIEAESQSEVDTKDEYTKDFEKGKFFHVEDFDFGIDVVDSDSSVTSSSSPQGHGTSTTNQTQNKTTRFSKWINGTGASGGPGKAGTIYPVQMEPFSFSKELDVSSPTLFQNCFQTKSFDSAVLVRRKVGGLVVGNDGRFAIDSTSSAVPYLRLEFKSVLIISVDWDGGDLVKEKVKFVCRTVSVKYRQQMHHGKPGATKGGEELSLVKAASGGSGG